MSGNPKIFVAGHRGLVGSAIVRQLDARSVTEISSRAPASELDLARRDGGRRLLRARSGPSTCSSPPRRSAASWRTTRPRRVHLRQPADSDARDRRGAPTRYEEARSSSVARASTRATHRSRSRRSTCSPARSSRRTKPTRSPRSPASSCARRTARSTASTSSRAMPTNLYGPGDNFDLAELARAAGADPQVPRGQARPERREVVVWGTGTPRREFLHVDDLADACLFLMEHYDGARARQRRHRRGRHDPRARRDGRATSSHSEGELVFDTSKPDGTPRKLLDVSRLHALGWKAKIDLEDGIRSTYRGSSSIRATPRRASRGRPAYRRAGCSGGRRPRSPCRRASGCRPP